MHVCVCVHVCSFRRNVFNSEFAYIFNDIYLTRNLFGLRILGLSSHEKVFPYAEPHVVSRAGYNLNIN